MDKLIYTAASGMKGHMASQAAIANNLANGATIGFRADRAMFDRIVVSGPGFDTRQPSSEEVVDADRRAGVVNQTGRPLDIAVDGDAWLAVQAADGTEAYTRRGDLQLTAAGVLQTGDGHPVIGQSGPITLPPAQQVSITPEGDLTIVPIGADPAAPPQVIDRLKLVSTTGSDTVKGLDNLLYVRGGGVLPADAQARVHSGALEESNVNMTEMLVEMIQNQRQYEVQANMIKEAKQMDESGASLMRMPA